MGSCTSPCVLQSNSNCRYVFPGTSQCKTSSCIIEEQYSTLYSTGTFITDSLNIFYPSPVFYNFRDNAISSNAFGTKYRNYYNTLSQHFVGIVNISTMINTAHLLLEVNPQIAKITDLSQSTTQIIINSALNSKIISLLNQYRSSTTNKGIQSIIDDIKVDVNAYTNQSLGTIRTALGI